MLYDTHSVHLGLLLDPVQDPGGRTHTPCGDRGWRVQGQTRRYKERIGMRG